MITIKVNSVSEMYQEVLDFFKSLASQASSKDEYEVQWCERGLTEDNKKIEAELSDRINFVDTPSDESRLYIILPNNCLVLHNSWDRYIAYNLDNDKTIGELFIKKRMGLVSRPDNGVFPGLAVEYPVAT